MLRIRDWNANFETHESRKLLRLTWVAVPNDLSDIRYRILIDHPDGAAHFGAWIAIVEIASTCKVRGTLADGGVPLGPKHLEMKSGIPEAVFTAAIPRIISLGWMEDSADSPALSPGPTGDSPDVAGKTSAYITETLHRQETNTCASGDAPLSDSPSMSSWWNGANAGEAPPDSQPETEGPTTAWAHGEERRRLNAQQDAWFEEWWGVYWLKKSRKRARAAFGKQVRTDARFREVMAATREQTPEMQGRQPQHRPHGDTWLNGERWNDETAAFDARAQALLNRAPLPKSTMDPETARRIEEKRRQAEYRRTDETIKAITGE